MEQVPHLAMYCHDNAHLFTDPIPHYLLPTVVRYLTDAHNQVGVVAAPNPVRCASSVDLFVLRPNSILWSYQDVSSCDSVHSW